MSSSTVFGSRPSIHRFGEEEPALKYLKAFSLYPPQWVFMAGDAVIKKTISFNQCVTITSQVTGEAEILLRPLITDRQVDQLLRDPRRLRGPARPSVRWSDTFLEGSLPFTSSPATYWNLLYREERERGYEAVEDLLSARVFYGGSRNGTVSLCCGRINQPVHALQYPAGPCSALQWLDWASEAFCHRDEIYAGYHWFCESWGRDSCVT